MFLIGCHRQVCLLLKRGANQYAVDERGQDPLAIAVETAHADIVTLWVLRNHVNRFNLESVFSVRETTSLACLKIQVVDQVHKVHPRVLTSPLQVWISGTFNQRLELKKCFGWDLKHLQEKLEVQLPSTKVRRRLPWLGWLRIFTNISRSCLSWSLVPIFVKHDSLSHIFRHLHNHKLGTENYNCSNLNNS